MAKKTADSPTSATGSRILGLSIGFIAVAVLTLLPFLVVMTFYVVANVYALIKGTTFDSESMNVGVFLTLLVFSVAVFPVALSVLISFIGRSLSPKRRR